MINPSDSITLKGLTGHSLQTVGSTKLQLSELGMEHFFFVTPKEFKFSDPYINGILGEDFLAKTGAILNFNTNEISFQKLPNNNHLTAKSDNDINIQSNNNKANTTISNNKPNTTPPNNKLNPTTSNNKSNPTISTNKANPTISNNKSNTTISHDKSITTTTNNKSNDHTISKIHAKAIEFTIPPRCEYLLPIEVETNEETICTSAEIVEGVFIGNSLHQPVNKTIFVPVMNTREESVSIKNFYPMTEPYNNIVNTINILNHTKPKDMSNFLKLSSDLNSEERNSIINICQEFEDLFHSPSKKLSHTSSMLHEIPIKVDTSPINIRPYRLPQSQSEFIKNETEKMLQNSIIKRSKSPWNFPLLVVPKKGPQKFRLVIDYRKLNDVTIGDAFPLPNITDIFDQLGFCQYFSSLDLATGYHQVLLHPNDSEKTAFSTPTGHYEFNRMPMGLKGAPATFQRLMTYVLSGLQGIKCLVYLDDIIVYGKTLNDHNNKLIDVFTQLRLHNLKLQPEKCTFLQKKITYLGHVISEKGIEPDPSKIECIKNYPRPTNIKEIQAFLGLANYYRRFINDFSKTTQPINQVLKKGVKFDWSNEAENAFTTLKNQLTHPKFLQFPNFEKEFLLTTDASGFAIGAVLSQGEIGSDLPISYASRSLNRAEKNYSTIEKELLAIVWAVHNFRPYLYGRTFTIISDHKPLVWVFNIKDPSSRLMRWRLKLEEYNYKVIHKAGKYNTNADALSRIILDPTTNPEINHCNIVTRQQTKTQASTKKVAADIPSISDIPDLLVEKDNVTQISDPNISNAIIKEFHDLPTGGHQGVSRTLKRIRLQYTWKNMFKDVRNYIKNCPSCQANKSGKNNKLPMALVTTSTQIFEKLYLDIVGPLPETDNANKYILTMQDDLSKFSVAVPLTSFDAKTVAHALVDHFMLIFGSPKIILTDQGTNFLSDLFAEVCQIFRIKKLKTTSYHPQTNGALERSHRTLKEYLRHYVDSNLNDWDYWITKAMFIYNTTPHTSTNFTPFKLLFGHEALIPSQITKPDLHVHTYNDYIQEMLTKLHAIRKQARENIDKSKVQSKGRYDRNAKLITFHVGDKVLYKIQVRKSLDPMWNGPYSVIKINSPENTTIFINRRNRRVHNNNLKLFHENNN